MTGRKLKLVKVDPWLEPSEKDIEERYERYLVFITILTGKDGPTGNGRRRLKPFI